jgi:hypothetical protein
MTEPLYIELNKDGDFDGVSPMPQSRDDFTVSGQRYYKANVSGPAGVIDSTLFGLFSDASPKLVGFAGSSFNPQSIARVLASDPLNSIREEIQLTPYVQHVLVFPGDRIAGSPRRAVACRWCSSSTSSTRARTCSTPSATRPSRRSGACASSCARPGCPSPRIQPGCRLAPNFVFNPLGLLVSNENGTGPIPTSDLSLYPRHQGVFLTVRYAGNGAVGGKLHLVDAETRQAREVESNLTTVLWSKVLFVSHDDLIGLEAAPAVAGPGWSPTSRSSACPPAIASAVDTRGASSHATARSTSPGHTHGSDDPRADRHRPGAAASRAGRRAAHQGRLRRCVGPGARDLHGARAGDADERVALERRAGARPPAARRAASRRRRRRRQPRRAAAARHPGAAAAPARPGRQRRRRPGQQAPGPQHPGGGRVGAPAGRARPLGHGDDPPVHSAAGLGAAEHHPQGGSGRGGHERRPPGRRPAEPPRRRRACRPRRRPCRCGSSPRCWRPAPRRWSPPASPSTR